MTAAGTTRPAQVLVLGAGVAGLQAIATARRLGALVTGYDVRDAAATRSIASARPLPRPTRRGLRRAGAGGYARELTDEEQTPSRTRWTPRIGGSTSSSPPPRCPAGGRRCWSPRRPRRHAAGLGRRRPGRRPARRQRRRLRAGRRPSSRDNGVTIIGAGNLPVRRAASRVVRLLPQHRRAARPTSSTTARSCWTRPTRSRPAS